MTPEGVVRCSSCRGEMEATREYGGDVRRCSRCGILWAGSGGLDRLRGRLRDGRLRADMAWGDLSASLTVSPA